MASTQRGISPAVSVMSYRPAGAAERPPKRLEIGDRQAARPGASVVVAVDGAVVAAATAHRDLLRSRLVRSVRIAPGGIAAIAAHRRPIGHRRWQRDFVERPEIAAGVDDLAADDRKLGDRIGDLVLRAGEVIA